MRRKRKRKKKKEKRKRKKEKRKKKREREKGETSDRGFSSMARRGEATRPRTQHTPVEFSRVHPPPNCQPVSQSPAFTHHIVTREIMDHIAGR